MEFKKHEMKIYFESIGSGLPIIMIHGNGPDHRSLKSCMEPCFKNMKNTFQRIYFDLPGFGKSTGSSWLSDAESMIELILAFIDELIPDQQFILVGNSYGGYLARGILKKFQKRVIGIFLLCPSVQDKSDKPPRCILEKDTELDSILTDEEKSLFEPVVVRQTIEVWKRYKEEIIPGLQLKDHDFYNSWRKLAYSFELNDLEYPFNKSALIISGRQDSVVGYNSSLALSKEFPRATVAVVDNAGHALQIEQPEIFNFLTIDWLKRIVKQERNGA